MRYWGWRGSGLNQPSAESLALRVFVGEELVISGWRRLGINQTSVERLALRIFMGEELDVGGGEG